MVEWMRIYGAERAISFDPNPHIPLQQTTDITDCSVVDPHLTLTVQTPTLKVCASVHESMVRTGQYHRKRLLGTRVHFHVSIAPPGSMS